MTRWRLARSSPPQVPPAQKVFQCPKIIPLRSAGQGGPGHRALLLRLLREGADDVPQDQQVQYSTVQYSTVQYSTRSTGRGRAPPTTSGSGGARRPSRLSCSRPTSRWTPSQVRRLAIIPRLLALITRLFTMNTRLLPIIPRLPGIIPRLFAIITRLLAILSVRSIQATWFPKALCVMNSLHRHLSIHVLKVVVVVHF